MTEKIVVKTDGGDIKVQSKGRNDYPGLKIQLGEVEGKEIYIEWNKDKSTFSTYFYDSYEEDIIHSFDIKK